MGAVKGIIRLVLTGSLAAALVTSCDMQAAPQTDTYTVYKLMCCTKADTGHVWVPGTTVLLHWDVQTVTRTGGQPSHAVTITAVLTGPFTDVSALQQTSNASETVTGSIIASDPTLPPPTPPITTFVLPPTLPPGYYQLNLNWDYGGGPTGARTIVRVGAN